MSCCFVGLQAARACAYQTRVAPSPGASLFLPSSDDLGRITIRIGERVIPGTDIRKKVLSLLTFLLTRPQFSASREQVIEALWPDMEPEAGANSLNQTSYFLRQVFEPKAGDDSSAGYLNSRADLIWLDPTLVHSRSSECHKLIAAIRRIPRPD